MELVVKGRVVVPDGILEGGWVAISEGRIAAVGVGDAPSAARIDDRGDALILPGAVDGQTHATSYKGLLGIADTTRSAIAGGVTTLVDMPYDNPEPLDRPERLDAKVAAIAAHAHADMALYGTATRETGVANLASLIDGGVVAFKISSFESNPVRFPRIGEDLVLDLMEALVLTRLPLGLHNEDQEIVLSRIAQAKAAGRDGIAAHVKARPEAAELAATGQFLALGLATGAHVHPVHLTTEAGFRLTGAIAELGAAATGELCVHYLWFDAARDGERLGARMKVNPPIRAAAIDGLWRSISEGLVAFVSSDHSSWPIDNKLTASIFDAGAGVPGLETLVPAFFTAAEARGLDAARFSAEYLAERPARFFGIDDRKGAIVVGREADLIALEQGSFIWDEAASHDGLNWSPFHGETFTVRVAASWLRGQLVWDGQDILNSPGSGRFVPRATAGWFATEKD
ncbi:Allantoinase [Rhizobium sp. CF080]|uniref:dihydroorotase n=1 Tax=Rhizobium sp. (strain CF080) TaxID=1144310 RepID=UPI0003E7DEC5|nr:amidohydrolase family protein [Rhizobium sp. CF080]EUB99138.1 Allantoinase [Rhizobium sp. CF080]